MGWACRKSGGYQGADVVERQRADGANKMLATFTVDADVTLLGRETIYRDGVRVGWLSSGGYGHTVGRGIGLGYVRHDGVTEAFVMGGQYELEVASVRVPATVHLGALYDAGNARVKG